MHEASFEELKADGKVTKQEIDALEEPMNDLLLDLRAWDKKRMEKPFPQPGGGVCQIVCQAGCLSESA